MSHRGIRPVVVAAFVFLLSISRASAQIVYDSFVGANGTALTAHNPETCALGRPWTILWGTMPTLSGGRLTHGGYALPLIDGGTPNANVYVQWQAGSSPGMEGALVFRGMDAQNFFVFRLQHDRLTLHRVVNNEWTQLWLSFLEEGNRGPVRVHTP
jgi:hypothetical protein